MNYNILLALNAHPKIGGQTIKKVMAAFDNKPERVWRSSQTELKRHLDEKSAQHIWEAINTYNPDEEAEKLKEKNIGFMTCFDKQYPSLLKEIYDCPVVLYVLGDPKALNVPGVGVVGSRKYTSYGREAATKFAGELARTGLSVVSGLALGIDAFAHRAALDERGVTVGVLGCGLDSIYPISNKNLAYEIINNGGAVISELPLGTPPLKQHFPARNRIIAGLSLGTLVIEAALESGALITAFRALDYNREVYAVPGNIYSSASEGTNLLIQKGAKLVSKIEDVLEELNVSVRVAEQRATEIIPETLEEKLILDVLDGERLIDYVVEKSKLNIVLVNSTLTILEMKGMVINIGGGRYRKKI